jgi:catechol 2,3-dioxygenase-like lactoylglutathione lyase family enzyme
MPENFLRIHDVTIVTDDVDAMYDFYLRLGLRPVFRKGSELAVFLVGTSELAIHAGHSSDCALAISLLVRDLSAITGTLHSMGIAWEGPMALRPGMMGLQFKDPKGNVVELLTTDL